MLPDGTGSLLSWAKAGVMEQATLIHVAAVRKERSMADFISDGVGVGCAPKGRKITAQGFNPGLGIKKRCAPLVRRSSGMWDEGGKGHQTLRLWVEFVHGPPPQSPSGATFGAHLVRSTNPGSKPWAKISGPFGADDLSLLILTRIDSGA